MADNSILFNLKSYTLNKLLNDIDTGEIGLPDLQRPFVWKSVKVRDLLDSMYHGFPVGNILLWKSGLEQSGQIGKEKKQDEQDTVIVDGQQRLTSLYSVIRKKHVADERFKDRLIKIAFNPKTEKFDVPNAAIEQDPEWIPDISVIWAKPSPTDAINEFVGRLKDRHTVMDEDRQKINANIDKLHSLLYYPFHAFELESKVNLETVADIFERLNSKATKLNQPDYMLTLMSVFWPKGRQELRRFSQECMRPPEAKPSPYNHYIEPLPNHLIRVTAGLGFRRAVLKYCYSILNGKDPKTGQITSEKRREQFEILKAAQSYALDLQHWHDFMKVLSTAGFRNKKMIASLNTVLFSYVLFLIGMRDYKVPHDILRKVIARWFFMSSIKSRYTASIESTFERDLSKLKDIEDSDAFVAELDEVVSNELTDGFWDSELPNNLDTSSARSPSFLAYTAALNLLDSRVLFSDQKIRDLMDPTLRPKKSAIELHHLFPKKYLISEGIDDDKMINQIANYAYLEWQDNNIVSDTSPYKYYPEYKSKVTDEMLRHHALPDGWEDMDYDDFLDLRRKNMAKVVQCAYESFLDHGIRSWKKFSMSSLDSS